MFTDREKKYMIENGNVPIKFKNTFLYKDEDIQISYSKANKHIEVIYFDNGRNIVFDDCSGIQDHVQKFVQAA